MMQWPLSTGNIKQKEAIFIIVFVPGNRFHSGRSLSTETKKFRTNAQTHVFSTVIDSDQALRTLSMWRVRSSILFEKPHSLSYHAMSLTK